MCDLWDTIRHIDVSIYIIVRNCSKTFKPSWVRISRMALNGIQMDKNFHKSLRELRHYNSKKSRAQKSVLIIKMV